jgi:hypothetical protein
MTRRIRNLGLVLSFEERKRLADYFAILLAERRNLKFVKKRGRAFASQKTAKSKTRKSKYEIKCNEIGPSIRGPLLIDKPKTSFVLQYHIFLYGDR